MQTALQLGQRKLPLRQILQHLTTSPFLAQYLRLVVIEETLAQWRESPEGQTIPAEANLGELESPQASQPESPSKIESTKNSFSKEESLTLQQYQQEQWGHKVSSYFLARKGQLDRAIFSAIQVDSLGMAQEIYLRVKDRRQSFDKLARLYSQGAAAKLGGVMGPISIANVHPNIAYHLIGLEPGELSPLFQVENFYVFIRLEQRLPARFDERMKGQLMEELFEQWLQTEITNRMSNLQMTTATDEEDASEASLPTPSVVGETRKELAQSEVEVIDPEQPILPALDPPVTTPHQSSTSFFPPLSDEPAPTEVVEHNNEAMSSSFFAPQSTPTQIINRQQQRSRQVLVQQVVAFFLFFSLFLGGGAGAVYLLTFLTGSSGMQTGHK
jgi:hypothetical protein